MLFDLYLSVIGNIQPLCKVLNYLKCALTKVSQPSLECIRFVVSRSSYVNFHFTWNCKLVNFSKYLISVCGLRRNLSLLQITGVNS